MSLQSTGTGSEVGPLDLEPPPEPGPTSVSKVRGAATALGDYTSVLGARGLSVLLSMASIMISTRILGPSEYGLVAFVALIGTLIFTITSAWTSTAVMRFGREQIELTGAMNGVTWARALLTAPLFLAAVGIIVILRLVHGIPSGLGWGYVGLAIALGALGITADHSIYMLEAGGRMKLSAVGIVVNQFLVVAAFAVIYVTRTGEHPAVILSIMAASSLLLTLWFGALSWRSGVWPPRVDRALVRRIAVFSVPLIAFTASQYVVSAVDLVVIRAFGTNADVGIYAVAYRGYTVLQSLVMASSSVLTPLFVSLQLAGRADVLRRYVDRLVPLGVLVGSAVFGLAAVLARPILPLVLGPGFGGVVNPFIVLLLANILLLAAQLLGSILVLYERTRVIAVANVIAAVANVTLDVVLIGVFHTGIVGAAIGTTAATLCICVGYAFCARECVHSHSLPNPLMVTPLVAAMVPALLSRGVVAVAVGIVLMALSLWAIVALLRPIGPQDRDLLERLNMPMALKRPLLRLTSA